MTELSYYHPQYHDALTAHRALGILAILIAVIAVCFNVAYPGDGLFDFNIGRGRCFYLWPIQHAAAHAAAALKHHFLDKNEVLRRMWRH